MDFNVGATEDHKDANEAFAELSMNKTLFVQKLTSHDAYQPELVMDLKTVDDVFNHYQPNQEMDFTDEDGAPISEDLRFSNLGDFGSKGIVKQSKYLQAVSNKQDQYLSIAKDLKSNKTLQAVLQNKETKEAFMGAIAAMIKDLEDAGA
jgi:predicted component of type VI protein secretion system